MTIQRRFAVLLAIFGVAVAGSVGAALWSFRVVNREVAQPFQSMMQVLRTLRMIKRGAEDQATLLLGPADWRLESGTPPEIPSETVREEVRLEFLLLAQRMERSLQELQQAHMWRVRAGKYAAENLRERIDRAVGLARQWLDDGDETARVQAGESLYEIHELIEAIEGRILDDARLAVVFGERLRRDIVLFLGFVALVAALVGVLSLALVRRWIVRPVADLRIAAERIGAGDFSHRVRIEGSDELAMLGREVNDMAHLVQQMQEERLERERLAVAGAMMRRLAHNIRNPLAGIRGLAELTRDELSGDDPRREHQQRIIESVDRFEEWLNGLLRATSPADVRPGEHRVTPWIKGIVAAHEPMARAKGVTIETVLGPPEERRVFDAEHLGQAVAALVANAIDATERGGRVRIRISDDDASGSWQIEVRDSGPGVPEDVLPNIFRPSFTTKKQGTGIGLASALSAVRAHHGRITVRNAGSSDGKGDFGGGAVFTIVLPRVKREADLANNGQNEEPSGQDSDHRGRGEPSVLDRTDLRP